MGSVKPIDSGVPLRKRGSDGCRKYLSGSLSGFGALTLERHELNLGYVEVSCNHFLKFLNYRYWKNFFLFIFPGILQKTESKQTIKR